MERKNQSIVVRMYIVLHTYTINETTKYIPEYKTSNLQREKIVRVTTSEKKIEIFFRVNFSSVLFFRFFFPLLFAIQR